MSDGIYEDVISIESEGTDRESVEMMVDIYESADGVRDQDFRTETNTQLPLQNAGSNSMKMRSSRAALVCLVLLCFLLLTAVIVLCVHIYTNNTNYTQERNQLLTSITNITEDRVELLTRITNLREEKKQILTNFTSLTKEKNQMLTNITRLTKERNQLLTNNTSLKKVKNQMLANIASLKKERDAQLTNNFSLKKEKDKMLINITSPKKEREQLLTNITLLTKEKKQRKFNQAEDNVLDCFDEKGVYIFHQFIYFMSSELKNWTESRRDCQQRGADLIIINNREEQDFVKKISGKSNVWIGLTDSEEEGRWKWVDGSNMTSGFWRDGEPSGGRGENCAATQNSWWYDYSCDTQNKWICENNYFLK